MERIQRFMRYVDKNPDGCWLWTGSTTPDGYGQFNNGGKILLAHRYLYQHYNGSIETGLEVRHKCRSRSCCNPEHLELGTRTENQRDRYRDGTDNTGTRNPFSKLTEQQVIQIRQRPTEKRRLLADEFNVSVRTIYAVINRELWKHI
jgi:hypothetical protein